MITVHLNGQQIGTVSHGDDVFKQLAAQDKTAEIRTADGEVLGRFIPGREPLVPWEPDVTLEELERRVNGPSMKLADFWKKIGAK